MVAKPKWLFWARGTLLSAICGHWIANTAHDPDQYMRAGLDYTWRASVPILAQTVLIAIAVLALGPLSRRNRAKASSPIRLRRLSLLTLLATSQLILFLLLEVSERIVQHEPFTEGLLASGFGFELIFAIGSALLLGASGSIVIRVIRVARRRPTTAKIEGRVGLTPQRVPPVHAVIVVGDVRAPPLVSA